MRKQILFIVATASSLMSWASAEDLITHGGGVEILAIGKPSFIKIRGTGKPAESNIKLENGKLKGGFSFDVKSIDTGIGLRNEHMRDKYLEIAKHPDAKLEIDNLALPEGWSPEKAKAKETPFKGKLTLHGVTREVTGTFSISESSAVRAEFKIKLSDYNITIPEYMGVKVADEVAVNVSFDKVTRHLVSGN